MGKKALDLKGKNFGRLTVRERFGSDKDGRAIWLCDCECGNTTIVSSSKLTSENTKSCGCLADELHKTHGMTNTRIYNIWTNMKGRCTNPNNQRYKNYGARGINVCNEWLNNFMGFYDWSMQNGYSDELTLDRIDVDGNYEPNNCRWVDDNTQANNKRLDKLYTYNGKTLSVRDWCKEIGFYWSVFGKNNDLPKEELSE